MVWALGAVAGSDFVTPLLMLRRRKRAKLLWMLALPSLFPLLYHALFTINIFFGVGQKL